MVTGKATTSRQQAQNLAGYSVAVGRPRNWDKCVSVAYLRILGVSQKAAARAASCGERTIRLWEVQQWWPDAQAEARQRWLSEASDAARATILKAIRGGDTSSARWFLERVEPALSQPSLRSGQAETKSEAFNVYIGAELPKTRRPARLAEIREQISDRGKTGSKPRTRKKKRIRKSES
jgi:hypothetical protein